MQASAKPWNILELKDTLELSGLADNSFTAHLRQSLAMSSPWGRRLLLTVPREVDSGRHVPPALLTGDSKPFLQVGDTAPCPSHGDPG